jgi:hypothetical protein
MNEWNLFIDSFFPPGVSESPFQFQINLQLVGFGTTCDALDPQRHLLTTWVHFNTYSSYSKLLEIRKSLDYIVIIPTPFCVHHCQLKSTSVSRGIRDYLPLLQHQDHLVLLNDHQESVWRLEITLVPLQHLKSIKGDWRPEKMFNSNPVTPELEQISASFAYPTSQHTCIT